MHTFVPTSSDDSSALQRMLDDSSGVVHLGPGNYRFGDVAIPQGVTLTGEGAATVIRSNGAKAIFRQIDKTGWALRDVTLDGGATGDWQQRDDAGESGIFTESCYGFEITGVTLRNFRGAALQMTYTKLGPQFGHWANGGMLDRITATDNYIGVRFDVRAEYMNATRLDCSRNVIGCVIHAGNAKISSSNFCSNIDGVLIEDKDNGSHGVITNTLINHNHKNALICRNVANGMMISNCAFFYGAILMQDCVGISLTGSMVYADVKIFGEKANRFAGNFIIPHEFKYEFDPSTLVEGNFDAQGRWQHNR